MRLKVTWIVLFCFTLIPEFVKNENLKAGFSEVSIKRNIYAEILSDSLTAQRWEVHDRPCLETMMSILDNAKNFTLWGVWFLDTIQPPIGHLYGQKYHISNYDECLKPDSGFLVDPVIPKTQYCVAEVDLTSTDQMTKPVDYVWINHNVTADVYLKKPTKHGRVMSRIIWGVCVPEVCQPSAVAKVSRSILQISHLGALSDKAAINVTHCENRETIEESKKPTVFKQVVLLLAAVAIFCTYYVKSGRAAPGTFVGELASSFNMSRNLETLTKVRDDEVYSMNIMRVLTSFFIVFVHQVLVTYTHFIANGLDQERSIEEGGGEIASHIEILVDTFLTLSGLLFVRGLFSDKWQNPLKFIWKRYIRLLPAMAALVFFMTTGLVGNGPMWDRIVVSEKIICKANWLTNLLMISNFNVDKMCTLVSWYVSCDFQLCIFATILYVIYKQNKILGEFAFAVSLVASMVIPGLMTYIYGFAPLLFHGVESVSDCRNDPEFVDFYVKSYCRAGPFLVGALMGYLMFTYKPKDYRKIIGTFSSYLGVVASLIVMVKVMTGGHYFYLDSDPLSSAIYVAYNRSLWGLTICIIIGISEYGNISLLNKAFSWYPLVPLSRLTYGVYLTHFPVLELVFCTMRTNFEFDMFSMGVGSAGTTVYALVASLVIWLLFEAPVININNMLLDKTWKNKTKESVVINNSNVNEAKKLT